MPEGERYGKRKVPEGRAQVCPVTWHHEGRVIEAW